MDTQHLADALASTTLATMNPYFAVQGLKRGTGWQSHLQTWKTLFAPYYTAQAAIAMRDKLATDNPACQYQAIRVEVLS